MRGERWCTQNTPCSAGQELQVAAVFILVSILCWFYENHIFFLDFNFRCMTILPVFMSVHYVHEIPMDSRSEH